MPVSSSAEQPEWGYNSNQLTPDKWPQHFQVGEQQSPINILVGECKCCPTRGATTTTTATTLKRCTCCRGSVLRESDTGRTRAGLAAKVRNEASAPTRQRRKSHLDSVGEEDRQHERNLSSSSASSSSSSSRRLNEDDDDDDDDVFGSSESGGDDSSDGASALNRCCLAKQDCGGNKNNGNRCPNKPNHSQQAQNTRRVVSLRKLFLGYPRFMNTMQLLNTGHNWQVNLPSELANHTPIQSSADSPNKPPPPLTNYELTPLARCVPIALCNNKPVECPMITHYQLMADTPVLSGPPLGDREYRLAQFHCHWGEDCNHGSEHQINGRGYAAEIHFVHWNCTDFASFEEASRHRHGLAVLAVLVQALDGEQNRNKHLDKIIAGLRRVHKPGAAVNIHARLDLKKLFPANRWNYATYEGSLTTPPLSEVVDWLVFLDPIQCSSSQVEQFRQIRCPVSGQQQRLLNNCRPIQPTGDRLVSIWSHH